MVESELRVNGESLVNLFVKSLLMIRCSGGDLGLLLRIWKRVVRLSSQAPASIHSLPHE